ncbi:MAG TPA: hypothetical protein VF933_31220, partial [Streptosporangiaceae bacterium]
MQAQVPPVAPDPGGKPSVALQVQGAAAMYRIAGTYSPAPTTPAPAEPRVQPSRDPPPGSPQAPGCGAAGPAEAIRYLVEDRERIDLGLADVVVRRLFT